MASGYSRGRYPKRGSRNTGARKAIRFVDSDRSEGSEAASLESGDSTRKRGGKRMVPCRRSQRMGKRLKTEIVPPHSSDEEEMSINEDSESETLDNGGEKMIPRRRSKRLQKKPKSEKATLDFTDDDDDEGSVGPQEVFSHRRSERLRGKNKAGHQSQISSDIGGGLVKSNSVTSVVSISDEASSEHDSTDDDMSISDGPTCDICQTGTAGNFLIKCKNLRCVRSYHTFCLDPPLNVAREDLTCPFCGGDEQVVSRTIQSVVGHRRVDLQNPKCASQMQFLVKWDSLSHHHDSWIPMEWLRIFDRMRLYSYQRKYLLMKDTTNSIDLRKPEWFQIDRVIACSWKADPANPCEISSKLLSNENTSDFKFLVKWKGLDYFDTTWESEMTEELRVAIDKLVARHQKALERDSDKEHELNSEITAEVYKGVLYDYQIQGVQWILDNFRARRNVILADEMGLGKTVQVACFLKSTLCERLSTGPALVVAPKSILLQWEKELGRWAGNLNVIVYQGDKMSRKCIRDHELYSFEKLPLFDVLVTSYEMVQLDVSILRKFNWSSIIIDEAHKIKNLYCKLFSCLKKYTSEFRLLLTGTPLQNSMLELFALLHFIDPIEFPDPESESKSFNGIQHSEDKISQIHDLLKPRMLRRLKSNVLKESLPTKKWVEVPCALTESQRELYIDLLEENYAKLNEGIQSGKKNALNCMLMSLKKCCNHPYLFLGQEECQSSDKLAFSSLVAVSGKLQLLEKLLPKLKERGNRVIIFSQMTRMLDIIEDFLSFLSFSYFRIDGQTSLSTRQQNVKEYNNPESDTFIFLMSTRAGGLGIDLPGADRVIIYDPDFNPFMDLQAQSRAHRIGQTRPVVVYQLITKGTVEEKILLKSKQKLALENIVMNPSKKPSVNDLHSVLLHGAHAILNRKKIQATSIHYDEVAIDNLLKLDPVPGETCASDDNGYLGSIESFKNGDGETEESALSPKKEEWKKLLGSVKKNRGGYGDLGRGKRVKKAVNYVYDEESDDDVPSSESASSDASDDDEVVDDEDDGDDDDGGDGDSYVVEVLHDDN
ncbi:chromatin remodeling factor [Rhynchospora pubera]|uniref:Chromatin remodeling factor n=1 Tax=Rhynchospora pubera TaxID=906938 RepID=A0AAV8CS25_9POAL|nr:chromatin remodeling factor [Rhynchospora pubera]